MRSRIHFDSGAYLDTDKIPLDGHITPHFTWEEYSNPSSGEEIACEIWPESLEHFKIVEEIRNAWCIRTGAKGVRCESGYRTKAFNAKVGGSQDSLHLHGCAADLQFGAVSDADWKWLIEQLTDLGKKYGTLIELGRYDWGCHIGSHSEVWSPYTKQAVYTYDKRTKK